MIAEVLGKIEVHAAQAADGSLASKELAGGGHGEGGWVDEVQAILHGVDARSKEERKIVVAVIVVATSPAGNGLQNHRQWPDLDLASSFLLPPLLRLRQKILHLLPRRHARHGPAPRHGQRPRRGREPHASLQRFVVRAFSLVARRRRAPFQQRHGEAGTVTIPRPRLVHDRSPRREGTRRRVQYRGASRRRRPRPPLPDQQRSARAERDQDVPRAVLLQRPHGSEHPLQALGGSDMRLPFHDVTGRHSVPANIVATAAAVLVVVSSVRPRQAFQLRLVRHEIIAAFQQGAIHPPVLPADVDNHGNLEGARGPREAEVDRPGYLALQ
mmetsp:Transcript_9433/g.23040  ORF Transcript_9433/g.23040 Transcript_9433/m.23040 type:complete len:327 (-) Transcript_9433:29-1009(-)